jgi:hypothetical protein
LSQGLSSMISFSNTFPTSLSFSTQALITKHFLLKFANHLSITFHEHCTMQCSLWIYDYVYNCDHSHYALWVIVEARTFILIVCTVQTSWQGCGLKV